MFEMEEGWLFQPGKVRGVRWTVHEVKTDGMVDEAEAMTSSVFQLLAGVRLRRVFALRINPLVTTAPRVAQHEVFSFYVADGMVEFATIDADQKIRELRVLYPGHGVVVPSGVIYSMCGLTRSVVIAGSDTEDDHPSEIVYPDREIPWLSKTPRDT